MPPSNIKNLTSLFRFASKVKKKSHADADADSALKLYLSEVDVPTTTSATSRQNLPNVFKSPDSKPDSSSYTTGCSSGDISTASSKLANSADESSKRLLEEISSSLNDRKISDPCNSGSVEDSHLESVLDIPWFSKKSTNHKSLRRKEISRERKQKFIFKNSQNNRFDQLVNLCGEKLGPDATIQVFGKLGRVTGLKEFNALICLCLEKARDTDDDEVSLEQIAKAYKIFESVKEQGFPIKEETYGPFLMYLIDKGLIEEFQFFCELIKDENSYQRFSFYEMLLWISVNDEKKISELCNNLTIYEGEDKSYIQENYLLALCERDRRKEFLLLLETFDITKVSSAKHAENIFRSLGKFQLVSFASRFLLHLKVNDIRVDEISSFICNYVTSLPNLAVEDVILRFKNMHTELELKPTCKQYEKLILHCCKSLKVHAALDIVQEVLESGIILSLATFHSLLDACDESCEYNLARRIYSMLSQHGQKPNTDTFRIMITLFVKMKDFEGAYGMMNELETLNLSPTTSMYNAVMSGYFREKNIRGALATLKQMEGASLKPNYQTFCYLLMNCNREEDINKILDKMKDSGFQATKPIYMVLINAYVACGQFERAKQVILNDQISVKSLNEIKNTLVSALASHGKIKDALDLYKEIKQARGRLEPKAIASLIECIASDGSDGELNRLVELLGELHDPLYWMNGCYRVIFYCVRHQHLRSAIDLLKQLNDSGNIDEAFREDLFDEVFSYIAEKEYTDMQFGVKLLQAIKDELGLRPSRKTLDFLLTACVNSNDLETCFLIWREYQEADLPYNVLSFLRMYQALLALGDHKSATRILNEMPKDDPHVNCLINAYQETFSMKNMKKKKKAKNGDSFLKVLAELETI